ncbi:hypothetical protein ID866_9723 [Astraeus odoratus]|nr:hypothetical protein ID866_9723 [Astraeus odoratus]
MHITWLKNWSSMHCLSTKTPYKMIRKCPLLKTYLFGVIMSKSTIPPGQNSICG